MHALFFLQSRFRQPGTLSGQGHPTLWQLWRARLQTHSCLSVGALAFHLLLLLLLCSSSLAFPFFSVLASSSICRHLRALFCCTSFKCFSPLFFFSCSRFRRSTASWTLSRSTVSWKSQGSSGLSGLSSDDSGAGGGLAAGFAFASGFAFATGPPDFAFGDDRKAKATESLSEGLR